MPPARFWDESWAGSLLERPTNLDWLLREEPAVRLEVGGSIREQVEGYRNFELDVAGDGLGWDVYHLHRLLIHADLQVEERTRMFAQFGNSTISGNERPDSPVDDDEAYLHQAFAEVALAGGLKAGESLELRLGRQELSFGSGRLVSLRDGPNIRRSFDAARLAYRTDGAEWEVFFGSEVQARMGNFDNRIEDDVLLWGSYATLHEVAAGAHLDLYYFGLDRENAPFDAGTAGEVRHSVGARLWGEVGRFDYNFEPVVQLGEFGDRDIRAWTLASDTGYRFGADRHAPHVGLRANVISGGSSSRSLRTFNALFPNNSYFSEAAIFAPANLVDVNPTLTLHPREDLGLTFMWDHLWRFDANDGIYVPPGVPLIAGSASRERYIGHALSLLVEWELARRTKLFAAFTHFEAGSAVERGGGEDLDYFLVGADWSF